MRFNRPQEEDFRPELTPLVDVVFQLVIFFMVSSVFMTYARQMNIEPPKSTGKPASEQVSRNTIEITQAEKIFLNGKELTLDALAGQLQAVSDTRAVVIRADKRLPYGLVMQVMEICEGAGITDIRTAVQ
ncbi:MAG: ExbD/TolR family protein [Planctomycetota bacterium]|jgi:biopolymer transport protein ExbD